MDMNISCKNTYTIRKVHADGHETTEAKFHNVCLQEFYDALIGRWMGGNNQNPTSCIHSVWFGTGSREPSSSDTSLQTPLWTTDWNHSNIISWEKYLNEDRHICHKYTFKIAADADHTGTVSEVGVVFITGKGYLGRGLATRALILDAEGHPMTITKTDLEVLYVDVIFEFTLQDSENFTWCPENYINYGARTGTGWAPIFTMGLFDRIFFLGKISDDGGFVIRHAAISFSKSYQDDNHTLIVSGARLTQETVTSQRYIKAIAIGSSSQNLILGYWKLPDADLIPPKTLSGMAVGVGNGTQREFTPPIAEWVANTEEIYVDDVQQVRGVDYTCDCDYNAQELIECSVLQDMEFLGDYHAAPVADFITPIMGWGHYENGNYMIGKWNLENPTLKYAFPQGGVKAIKKFVFKNFRARTQSGTIYIDTNWNGKTWTVQYSNDNEEWTTAGTCTMDSNQRAELIFDTEITARYWRFTISGLTRGHWFSADSVESIMAYGSQKGIVFATVPADGAVITMKATVACPMKNSNFVIDCNPTFTV